MRKVKFHTTDYVKTHRDFLDGLMLSKPSSNYDEAVKRHQEMLKHFLVQEATIHIKTLDGFGNGIYLEAEVKALSVQELYHLLTGYNLID